MFNRPGPCFNICLFEVVVHQLNRVSDGDLWYLGITFLTQESLSKNQPSSQYRLGF